MSIVLDGSNGVTFPNGSNPQAAPSKVLQVVNTTAQYSGAPYFSTSSTSLVSTGLSATINPLFSTSKILILVNGGTQITSAYGLFSIYRNSTNLATGTSPSGLALVGISSGTVTSSGEMSIVDSPATTSATTYTVYAATNTGTVIFGAVPSFVAGGAVSITVMEIAA